MASEGEQRKRPRALDPGRLVAERVASGEVGSGVCASPFSAGRGFADTEDGCGQLEKLGLVGATGYFVVSKAVAGGGRGHGEKRKFSRKGGTPTDRAVGSLDHLGHLERFVQLLSLPRSFQIPQVTQGANCPINSCLPI